MGRFLEEDRRTDLTPHTDDPMPVIVSNRSRHVLAEGKRK
jgi:hypothetical protein